MVKNKICERTLRNLSVLWEVNKYLHVLQLVVDFIRSMSKVPQNFEEGQKKSAENL